MKSAQVTHRDEFRDITHSNCTRRRAVGYIRVSDDMQAADGMSLDAQTAAIEQYCMMQGLRLAQIHKDALSGGKTERPGLQDALRALQRGVEVIVVLKFDRLSRSIKHFCELYETYFKTCEKELVAIRESIRLDSSLRRALVSMLLVFAQMEREATAERTKEALRHMKTCGYRHGKPPYGYMKIPRQDSSRFKVIVEQLTLNLEALSQSTTAARPLPDANPFDILRAENRTVRRQRDEAAAERERLAARMLQWMAPRQYLEHAAASRYDITRDPLIQCKRDEIRVEGDYFRWQEANGLPRKAREFDEAQTDVEQAYAAAFAARWAIVHKRHRRLKHDLKWIVVGFLLDPQSEDYLLKLSMQRIERMERQMVNG